MDDYDDSGDQRSHEHQQVDANGDVTMEDDLYDERPVNDEAPSSDVRPLESRVSIPQDRSMEQYGDNVAPAEPLDGQNNAVRCACPFLDGCPST